MPFAKARVLLCLAVFPLTTFGWGNYIFRDVVLDGGCGGLPVSVDLSVPTERAASHPGLVIIHGGGWSHGDKSYMEPYLWYAAQRGYLVLNVNYPLASYPTAGDGTPDRFQVGARYLTPYEGVRCAMRYFRWAGPMYGLDVNRIGVFGHSAGGHLAALVAARPAGEPRPQAVAVWAGIADLALWYHAVWPGHYATVGLIGAPPEGDAYWQYVEASPAHHVDWNLPPTYWAHGANDDIVPATQASEAWNGALWTRGQYWRHYTRIVPGAGHTVDDLNAVWAETLQFLDGHLSPP